MKKHRLRYAAIGGIVLVGILGMSIAWMPFGPSDTVSSLPTFVVREGPLLMSVTESGTISSRDQEIIRCEVEGQTQILWLIPEGQRVKKGDLLVELDASALEDRRIDQDIAVQNAEAAFINARENLEVVKSQNESNVSRAKLDLQFAQEDLTKYNDGDYPMQVKEAQARITLAELDLARATKQLEGTQRLFGRQFVTGTDLETDQRAFQRAKLDLELGQANMELLSEYTHKRQLTELESNIEEAQRALNRANLVAAGAAVQAEATLKARESEFERQKSKLSKVVEQIAKTKLYAPVDGMVVYATSQRSKGRRREPLEEGQSVYERQELICIPSSDSVSAEVSIHETNLNKVRPGLGARITVDALPGKTFTGTITRIATVPDAESSWMNPNLRLYPTTINIDNADAELRVGMGCRAEIMVERHEKAIYVPVPAVLTVQGKPSVFVLEGDDIETREVEVGLDNNTMIHIAKGLEPGEEVLLTPPLEAASKRSSEESIDGFVEASEAVGAQPVPAPPTGGKEEDSKGGGKGASPDPSKKKEYTPEQLEKWRKRMEADQGAKGAAGKQ